MIINKTRNKAQHEFSRLFSGSAYIFLFRISGAAITFVTQVFLARWMGAAELGIYVLAFSWCILLSTITCLGFQEAAIRFIGQGIAENNRGLIKGFLSRGKLVVAISSIIVVIAGAFFITNTNNMQPGSYESVLLIALVIVPMFALINFQAGAANAMSWFVLSFIPNNVIRPLLLLLTLLIVWFLTKTLDAKIAMLIHMFVIMLTVLGVYIVQERRFSRYLLMATPVYETRLWLRTAIPLQVITLFTVYFPEITIILLGFLLPSEQIAIYSVCYRAALIVAIVISAVNAFTVPEVARLHTLGDVDNLQRTITHATRVRFLSALIAVIGFIIFGKYFLAMFGEDFVMGYTAMIILLLAQLFRAGVGPVTWIMNITGHQDQCLRVFAFAFLLAGILISILVPHFGIIGAAIAVLFVILFWSLWLHKLVVDKVGIKPSIFYLPMQPNA